MAVSQILGFTVLTCFIFNARSDRIDDKKSLRYVSVVRVKVKSEDSPRIHRGLAVTVTRIHRGSREVDPPTVVSPCDDSQKGFTVGPRTLPDNVHLQVFPHDGHDSAPRLACPRSNFETDRSDQCQLLGGYLRRRYVDSGFLHRIYNATELSVRSTDTTEAITCAYAQLHSMYPPSADTEWMPGMGWQLIPVHMTPEEDDNVLRMDRPCPAVESVTIREILDTSKSSSAKEDYRGLLSYLEKHWRSNLESWREFDRFYQTMLDERSIDLSRPSWLTKETWNRTAELHARAKSELFRVPRVQKLRGGPLFRDIAQLSIDRIRSSNVTLKFYAYSTTAETLAALLGALLTPEPDRSDTNSRALLFEIYEWRQQFFVKLLRISDDGKVESLPIKICSPDEFDCPLERFVEIARSRSPPTIAEWSSECGIVTEEHREIDRLTVTTEILGFTTAVFLILFVSSLVYFLWRPSERSGYSPIKGQ